jgi:hypothetical protein
MASILTNDALQKIYDDHSQVLGMIGDAVKADDNADLNTLRDVANGIVGNTLTRDGNTFIDQLFKEELDALPDDEYKKMRQLYADSYYKMIKTQDDALSVYVMESKADTAAKREAEELALNQYLVGIFNGNIDKLKDKQYKSQFYGQLIETYDENTGKFMISVPTGANFNNKFIQWFYPMHRALEHSKEGAMIEKTISDLNSKAMGTAMTLDMNNVRAFQALDIGTLDGNFLVIGKSRFEIGTNIRGKVASELYKKVLERLNNSVTMSQFSLVRRNFSAEDMHTINSRVQEMFRRYAN